MNEYLLLMHSDALDPDLAESAERWERYLSRLRASGNFDGGSSIGMGARFRKGENAVVVAGGISGFLRVRAGNLEDASLHLLGNPNFDAGGTVEIRELLKD